MTTSSPMVAPSAGWRTPMVIIACGCAIGALTFGPRSALGLFMTPISMTNGWGREVFSLALALQNLMWGVTLPIAGALADMFGTTRVLLVGMLAYIAGLALTTFATTPGEVYLTAGILLGMGVSACSFSMVVAAFGKLLPPKWRAMGVGLGTAAGSLGQLVFSPLSVALQGAVGWQDALLVFAAMLFLVIPLSFALSAPPGSLAAEQEANTQTFSQQLVQALRHKSYVLLVIGYFTCGFQLQFITAHLPAYLSDVGMSADLGGKTLAVIGLFNIFGAITSGWLGERMPKRLLLSALYLCRAITVFLFITFPVTPLTTLAFGASMGFMWLSTVPPTNALVLVMFGTRWLSMLTGFAFFSHQVGSFLGVWLGGVVYQRTGSYELVWYLSMLLGLLSALINLPIVEKPAPRVLVAAMP